jgi:insulysin
MEKIEVRGTNEYVYHEELSNGLNVYMYSTKNTNEYAVSFFTKYGSTYNNFKSQEDKKFKEYPKGIAHFLEHKLFESETDFVMDYFSKSGTQSNAYTTYFTTNYIIEGDEEFDNNLNYLLDFVQSPYFTYENVEKEKGIIEQELTMYMDNPYHKIHETNKFNLVVNHPIRYDIGGTPDDIKLITKEMLDDCYSTFYSPDNMYLVITGNIDIEETIKIVRDNQARKNINNISYSLMEYDEPSSVIKEKEILNINVDLPIISIGIKIPYSNYNKFKIEQYINSIFLENFSLTSDFYLQSLKSNRILRPIDITIYTLDKFITVFIMAETNYPEELISNIKNKLHNLTISKSFFDRRKKKALSNVIYNTESHNSINDSIVDFLIDYGYIGEDIIEVINELNYEELEEILNGLQLDSVSYLIALNDGQK